MDDDKPRRNLLIGAGLVVLAWWLEVAPADLAERIMGLKGGSNIEPWKAWAAVLAVLFYLGYRYSYSEAAAEAAEAWSTDWTRCIRTVAMMQVKAHVWRATKWGIESSLFNRTLLQRIQVERESLNLDKTSDVLRAGGYSFSDFHFGARGFVACRVAIPWAGSKRDAHRVSTSGGLGQCAWKSVGQRAFILTAAYLLRLVRSRSTSLVAVPWGLALAASGMAGYRLATTF